MARKLLVLLAAIAILMAVLSPWGNGSVVDASTNPPSPTPTYCYPIYTPVPGAKGYAAPMATELNHAESCSAQYGDLFSDGAFFSPAPQSTGNSFTIGIQPNIFAIQGRRVPTLFTSIQLAASSTNYCYVDSSGFPTGIWNCNLLNTPPNVYSELMMTVVTNGAGVTSVSTPPPVQLFVPNITLTSLAGNAGQCAIFNADGSLSPSASCGGGGGGGVTSVGPGTCFSPAPQTGNVVGNVSGPGCTPMPMYPGPCTSPYATQYPDATYPTGVAMGLATGGGCGGGSSTTIVAGNCATVTPTASPTGGTVVGFGGTGCTPTPGPALPLSVANGGTGTAQPSPNATATDCDAAGVYSGSWPSQTFHYPFCIPSPNPTSTAVLCTKGSGTSAHIGACPTNSPLDAVQLADGAQHQWTMSDPSPCPTFADTGLAGTHYSLYTPNPAPSGLTCGAPSITSDGEASVEDDTSATSDTIRVPSAAEPSSSPASSSAWTIELVMQPNPQNNSATMYAYSLDVSNHLTINCTAGSSNAWNITSNINGAAGGIPSGIGWGGLACRMASPILVDFTFSGSTTTLNVYVNGLFQGFLNTSGSPIVNANADGALFSNGAVGGGFTGRISKLAFYNSVLSRTQLWNHYFAMRCGALILMTCAP